MTKKPAQVFHFDLYGKREDKYNFLNENSIQTIDWKELQPQEPEYYFKKNDTITGLVYKKFIPLNELFNKSTIGVQTHRDELVVDFNKNSLISRLNEIFNSVELSSIINKYKIKQSNSWNLLSAINKIKDFNQNDIKKLCYRPFDDRFIYYNDAFVDRTRRSVGKEVVNDNLVLNFPKIVKVNWNHSLITKSIPTAISMDINGTYFAPLYLYPETTAQQTLDGNHSRVPNLNPEIVKQIADGLGLAFVPEKEHTPNPSQEGNKTFAPIDLLDYIYAVLHSPTYREKYKEFLKIDFPRVPFPHVGTGCDLSVQEIQKRFWELAELGGKLRQIHLLESPIVEQYITQYPEDGNNVVVKPRFEINPVRVQNSDRVLGKVHINETQYFDNVPEVVWNFYIGGYQPAQKWLKDRKDRELSYEDILHYQKIIVALSETSRIMAAIDNIEI